MCERKVSSSSSSLDRAMNNRDGQNEAFSDHVPLLIHLKEERRRQRRRRFRFENMWLRDSSFEDMWTPNWHKQVRAGGRLLDKLQRCQRDIIEWNNQKFGNVQRRIAETQRELEELKAGPISKESKKKEGELSRRLDEWWVREEVMWHQRSKVQWLKVGDRQTVFQKIKASERRRRKLISRLQDVEGNDYVGEEQVLQCVKEFYKRLFEKENGWDPDLWNTESSVIRKILDDEDRRALDAPFSKNEIEATLFSMNPNKSPGRNGFNAKFFQSQWRNVKEDICNEVLRFLNDGELDERLNETLVVLIPKVNCPEKVTDLRPISLCNIVMRVITKCLSMRLKPLLQKLISQTQSAFVEGRLITDNVLECRGSL